jgi:hypothetical protein
MWRMRMLLCALVLATSGCASTERASGSAPPSPTPDASSSAVAAPVEPPQPPASSANPAPSPEVRVENPSIAVNAAAFPIVRSLLLKSAPVDDAVTAMARAGVERYLVGLDAYRDSGFDITRLGLSGRFRDAVAAGLKDSATPGVKRAFAIRSLRVERQLVKPWGVRALTDVSVTIVDRAVSGPAPDQVETGLLRLIGDRPWVVDAWDAAAGRWWNGAPPVDARIRSDVVDPIGFYLRLESWVPRSTADGWRTGDEATPFWTARSAIIAALDRSRIASRLFEGVTATVEQFDTFADIDTGIATVRLAGTILTTGTTGQVQRTPFERRVKVFLFGNWLPEVVDEQAVGGWLSGRDLALQKIDVNRA